MRRDSIRLYPTKKTIKELFFLTGRKPSTAWGSRETLFWSMIGPSSNEDTLSIVLQQLTKTQSNKKRMTKRSLLPIKNGYILN